MKKFGSFTLDTLNECLWRAGVRISLPPKPFAVLRYLVEHAGRLVSHEELLDALWPETYVQPQVLRTYMLDLRKVLQDDARSPRFIQSLPKRGYCFIACVMEGDTCTAPGAARPHQPHGLFEKLVGREREIASLRAALHEAAAGARQVILITGELGIGKTALLDEFRQQIESSQSAVVAFGQCIPGFAGVQEYYPLADALRELPDCPHAVSICRILRSGATAPIAKEAATETSASTIPGDVCISLEELGAEKTLLLILEDLQWADDATVNVLSALARRRGNAKLMIVATFAPQTGSTAEGITRLMHDLCMRRLCKEVALPRLSKASVADLIRAHLQQESIPDGLHELVHQHSEGNPRFVLAILEHLKTERLLTPTSDAGGEWQLKCPQDVADAGTPGELARMIELEIDHLPAHEQQLLEAGSLATVAFPAWLVAAALGQDVAATEEACDALARRVSFVKRAGEDELPDGTRSSFYVFAHAMFRDVLYQRQSPSRRGLRHIRIADRLRELFRDRQELIAREAATHYEAGSDWTNAVSMLHIASRRAVDSHAYSEAADIHEQIARIEALMPHKPSHIPHSSACDELMWSSLTDDHIAPRSTPAKA